MAFDSLGESLGMSDPGREAKVSFYQEALNRLGQQYAGAGNYAAGAHSILELQLKNAAARQGYQHEEWSLPTQDALYTRDFWDDQGFDDCWEGYRRMVARGQPCRGVVGFERPRAVGTVPFHLTPHKWHLETTRSRDAGDPLLRTVTGADDEGFEPKDFGDFEEEEGVKTSDAGLRQQHDDDASELGKSRELDNNDVSPLDRLDRWGGPEDEDLMVTAQVGYDDNDENNDMHQNHLGEDMEVDKEGKDGKDSPTIRGEHSRKSPDVDTVVNMQPSPRTPGAREQKRARGRPRIKEHPTAPIRKVTWDRCGHSVMASFPPLVFFVSRETSERRQWHQFRKRLRLFKKDVDGLHGVAFVLASSAFLSPLQSEVHVDPRVGFLCSRLDNLNLTDELPESVARPAKLTTPTRRALRKGRSGKGDHDVSANPWHISWDEVTWPPTGVSVFQKPSVALDDSQNASYDIFSGGSSPQAAEDMWDPAAAGENRSSRSRSCDVGISRAAVSDIMSSSDYVEVLRGLFDSSSLTQGGVYPPYGTGGMTGTGTATTARHSSQILQQYYAGAPVLPSAEASSDRSDSRRHSFDKNEDAITSSSRRTSGSDEPLPQENGLWGRPHQGGQQQNLPGLSHPLAGHSESSMHTGANLSRGESADDRNSHLTTLGMTSSSLPSISADMGSYSDTWSGKEKDTTRAGFKSFLYALLRRQVAAGRAVSPDVNLFDDGAASTPAPAHGSRSGGEASGSIAYLPFSQIVPRGRVSTTTAARAFQHLLGLHSRGEITLQQKQVNINQVTDDYEGMTTTPHPLYITASTQEILLFNNQTFHPDIHGLTTLSCEASLHSDKHTLSRIMTRHHVSSPCNSGRVTESHHILVGA
ncbi:hypothetical protein CSUI_001213 [Cystoisospora suis]|uniref:Uncharacterized protein n=1 Tax=Cystoisospora suis TaxID=483139 RepID=A0A2C6LBA7_9APIC|nr:hypothetical protein CSUI_001213 [Cystoisospora suis]